MILHLSSASNLYDRGLIQFAQDMIRLLPSFLIKLGKLVSQMNILSFSSSASKELRWETNNNNNNNAIQLLQV